MTWGFGSLVLLGPVNDITECEDSGSWLTVDEHSLVVVDGETTRPLEG